MLEPQCHKLDPKGNVTRILSKVVRVKDNPIFSGKIPLEKQVYMLIVHS